MNIAFLGNAYVDKWLSNDLINQNYPIAFGKPPVYLTN